MGQLDIPRVIADPSATDLFRLHSLHCASTGTLRCLCGRPIVKLARSRNALAVRDVATFRKQQTMPLFKRVCRSVLRAHDGADALDRLNGRTAGAASATVTVDDVSFSDCMQFLIKTLEADDTDSNIPLTRDDADQNESVTSYSTSKQLHNALLKKPLNAVDQQILNAIKSTSTTSSAQPLIDDHAFVLSILPRMKKMRED
ncbi:hypothetical protein EVAR_14342_1 [Eumeta japonica]|uniref:Uncharacterized protein n=1 Tax=Eumeta variegata TaxID=151549 RepID=A0A4C1TWY7_EUMVA|nr:hypothetical protein EVAR_14342_1 [Eumeta japonica]